MEAGPGKQRCHQQEQKRRERGALHLHQEKQTGEEEEGEAEVASQQDDHDEFPPRSSKDKLPRSKPKKGTSALFEEDVIDGFAILSFKTLEELEVRIEQIVLKLQSNIKTIHSPGSLIDLSNDNGLFAFSSNYLREYRLPLTSIDHAFKSYNFQQTSGPAGSLSLSTTTLHLFSLELSFCIYTARTYF